MAQLLPLPLTVSCFSKIQIGFTFLVQADPDSVGQRAVKWMCVCVCVCVLLLLLLLTALNSASLLEMNIKAVDRSRLRTRCY